MNKSGLFAICTAALLAAGLAAPASARWTPFRADVIRDQIEALDDDIDRADTNDTISEREAGDLRARLNSLRSQFRAFNSNGLNLREVRVLLDRGNYIRSRLNLERFDWDRVVG